MDSRIGWMAAALIVVLTSGASAQEALRVASYNIRASAGSGNPSLFGFEIPHLPALPRRGLKGVARVLNEAGVDFVGLQEVFGRSLRSWGQNQTAYLADRLGGFDSRFEAADKLLGGAVSNDGNAVLSRYELVEYSKKDLGSGRLAMFSRLRTPGGAEVWVVNTHLASSEGQEVRLEQIDVLEGAIGEITGPVIVMGDLNARPDSRELEVLLAEGYGGRNFRDAAADAGDTYPAKDPGRRIDYVLVSEEFEVLGAQVLPAGEKLSDHLPVFVELRLTPRPEPAPLTAQAPLGGAGLFGLPVMEGSR